MSARAIEGKEEGRTQESRRVDRLSLLPPELLEIIFEHTYSDYRPTGPLSKHLYPFFLKHFHRRLSLFSPRQVEQFLAFISQDREKATLVKSLYLDSSTILDSFDSLQNLCARLPNIIELKTPPIQHHAMTQMRSLCTLLGNVKTYSTWLWMTADTTTDLDPLAFLPALPSLTNLYVSDWKAATGTFFGREVDVELTRVVSLRIEGEGAPFDCTLDLIKLCPSLLHLDLVSTYSGDVPFTDSLAEAPTTLQFLTLSVEDTPSNPRDDFLTTFTQLRFLHLGRGCYSATIHATLSQLSHLVEFRLGEGDISPLDFLPLVSGPTRLVNLKRIILDHQVGYRCGRISFESCQASEKEFGWGSPGNLPFPFHDFDLDDEEEAEDYDLRYFKGLRKFTEVAEANGVEVGGTVHEALGTVEDYWIESSNRAILGILIFNHDFQHLRRIRKYAHRSGVSLPPLDVDSPNRNRLELVKIESANRDWIVYTLKDAGGVLSKDENGVEVGEIVEWS